LDFLQGSSGGSHQRCDPTDDPGIAQSAGRLHEVYHLAHDPMHCGILARQALQGRIEIHALAEIMRTLPACLLIDEVALNAPRGLTAAAWANSAIGKSTIVAPAADKRPSAAVKASAIAGERSFWNTVLGNR
jgi:hypothetical protein